MATTVMPKPVRQAGQRRSGGQIVLNAVLLLIVLGWCVPTVGLLISSFRSRFDIQTSGWWSIFPHRAWLTTEEFPVPDNVDRNGVMSIRGANATFEQFREGVVSPDGSRLVWIGNRRTGTMQVQSLKWTAGSTWTLDNYAQVLGGKTYEIRQPEGRSLTSRAPTS